MCLVQSSSIRYSSTGTLGLRCVKRTAIYIVIPRHFFAMQDELLLSPRTPQRSGTASSPPASREPPELALLGLALLSYLAFPSVLCHHPLPSQLPESRSMTERPNRPPVCSCASPSQKRKPTKRPSSIPLCPRCICADLFAIAMVLVMYGEAVSPEKRAGVARSAFESSLLAPGLRHSSHGYPTVLFALGQGLGQGTTPSGVVRARVWSGLYATTR